MALGEGGETIVNQGMTLRPDPGLAEVCREALDRHQNLGKTLFGPP